MSNLSERFASLPRFRCEDDLSAGLRVELTGEEARHALRVRRMRPGDPLALINGRGTTARGTIVHLTTHGVLVELEETAERLGELAVKIVLYQALVKHRRFESALVMTVELGVAAIIPLISERSVTRPNRERLPEYLSRWHRIAWEETKLSERSVVPVVGAPVDLTVAANCSACDYKVILSPHRGAPALDRLVENLGVREGERIALIVGPEGDFTDAEMDYALTKGCLEASLGNRLLRSEVAGVAAVVATLSGLGALEELQR
ncbi:16S rRNA (uracil(1498)-N(3))-methyltransferase [bacterium]|nr:16S rRNA (uracil(1498)-N(3))-methyltransferase [bacterium]